MYFCSNAVPSFFVFFFVLFWNSLVFVGEVRNYAFVAGGVLLKTEKDTFCKNDEHLSISITRFPEDAER